VTVGQLTERWVEHRRPDWDERSPGQPDATLARIRNHNDHCVMAQTAYTVKPIFELGFGGVE
jgi:hypothetical protein